MSASSAAQAERDAGIGRAVAHAERVEPRWAETAFQALAAWCQENRGARISAPQFRQTPAGAKVPEPPHLRAWGGVFQRAALANLVERDGYAQAEDPRVHCSIVTVWRVRS